MKKVTLKCVQFKDNGEYRVMAFTDDAGIEFYSAVKEIATGVQAYCAALMAQMKIEVGIPIVEMSQTDDGLFEVAAIFPASANTLLFKAHQKETAEGVKQFIEDFLKLSE